MISVCCVVQVTPRDLQLGDPGVTAEETSQPFPGGRIIGRHSLPTSQQTRSELTSQTTAIPRIAAIAEQTRGDDREEALDLAADIARSLVFYRDADDLVRSAGP
ncbi:hypothetical protein [Cryptosporangium sp. NPDC051539]|uniref:hypothetical protein n=1 Tax=Cryptosporangium sp. NPDC051539 TaxID=3363962 RepID=UPI00378B3BBB